MYPPNLYSLIVLLHNNRISDLAYVMMFVVNLVWNVLSQDLAVISSYPVLSNLPSLAISKYQNVVSS